MTLAAYHYQGSNRVPFDPEAVIPSLAGCLLCGQRPIAVVGVFIPTTDRTRQAVLTLRRNAQRPGSQAGLCYGLCERHGQIAVKGRPKFLRRIERQIMAMARRVTVQ